MRLAAAQVVVTEEPLATEEPMGVEAELVVPMEESIRFPRMLRIC